MKNSNLLILALIAVAVFYFGPGLSNTGSIGGNQTPVPPGTAPLSTTQTIQYGFFDADKPATAVTGILTVFLDPNAPIINPGRNTTVPGSTVYSFATASGFFSTKMVVVPGSSSPQASFTTPLNVAAPQVSMFFKAVDAPTLTVYNGNGVTANTGPANVSIGSGGANSFQITVQQGTIYKHLAGEAGTFSVLYNMSNLQGNAGIGDWSPGQFTASFDGNQCTPFQPLAVNFSSGNFLAGFTCTGDFKPSDSGYVHRYNGAIQATSGRTPPSQNITVQFVGNDWFIDTISGKLSGPSPVNNAGTPVQQFRSAVVAVN